jgi:proteasome inhibitor subunit 1 (PI31)
MVSAMFGWEWSYRLVEKDITKKEDVLVALLHWYFIKFGFKCIGLGDSVSNEVSLMAEPCYSSCQ